MKKLMFAAAVIAAGVACADVTSANVVGFQNIKVDFAKKYNFMVGTFDKIDGTEIKLKDIKADDTFGLALLSFVNPDGTTRQYTIPEIIAEGGSTVDGFSYISQDAIDAGDVEVPEAGWYFADGEITFCYYPFNNEAVPFGSTFFIYNAEDDANIVFSGSVVDKTQPIDVVFANKYSYMGNCSPVDLKLGDIGASETFGLALLSFLNPDGTTKQYTIPEIIAEGGGTVDGFSYISKEAIEAGDVEVPAPGWYFADGEITFCYYPFNEEEVPAGSTFFIYNAEDDAQIFIPPAITKPETK